MGAHQNFESKSERAAGSALELSRLTCDPFFPDSLEQGYPALSNQILAFHGLAEIHDYFGYKAAHQQVFGYSKPFTTELGKLAEVLTCICSPFDPFVQELANRIRELAETPVDQRSTLDIKYIPGSIPVVAQDTVVQIAEALKSHSLVASAELSENDIATSIFQTFHNNHPGQLEREQLAVHLMLAGLKARGFLKIAE